MKSKQLEKINEAYTTAMSDHIIGILARYYQDSDVGDNPLELPKKHQISYDDGAEYVITGIEMFFEDDPKGEMFCHYYEDGNGSEDKRLIKSLSLKKQIELLEAFEKAMKHVYDDEPFMMPKELC